MSGAGPRVLFVIHQIGSGADGGIRSIGEMIRSAPSIERLAVTNIEGPIADGLRGATRVEIWPMTEAAYNVERSKLAYRSAQVRDRALNNLRAYWLVRRRGIDVLHANDLRAFWNTAFGARLAGAKLILNVRDTMLKGGKIKQWRRALELCDRFLVLSQEMVEHWRSDLRPVSERSANRDKFAYIYSIVDRSRYSPIDAQARSELRHELGIDDSRPALVYVGRFDDKKAQLAFIEGTLPLIATRRPDAVTYFVGDFEPERDAYAAACQGAVARLGLADQVRFMGYSTRVADWYRAADVVALASQREGLPRCMIESLACGAVFASFDVSSTREILEGHDCGLVVAQGDHAGLAQGCIELLSNRQRAERYRARGPKVVEQLFDSERNGAAYRRFLAQLLGSSR